MQARACGEEFMGSATRRAHRAHEQQRQRVEAPRENVPALGRKGGRRAQPNKARWWEASTPTRKLAKKCCQVRVGPTYSRTHVWYGSQRR